MHILIVDDEELIRSVIKDYIEEEHYTCDEASDGKCAIELVEKNNYDLVIMDIMMPHMDGYHAIKEIKEIKNIHPKELIDRIKAVTKRNGSEDILIVGHIELNNNTREVKIDDNLVELTHTQFELLKLFLTNINIALSRDKIIESIWGYDYEADDRTIDAHIKLLRSKLGKYRKSIKTIRKVGYRFVYEE